MTPLTLRAVLKAFSFIAIGLIATIVVVNTLSEPVTGQTTSYKILFTDAEGLTPGNPVTMSGVRIGRVDAVRSVAQDDGTALAEVDVTVQRDHPVPDAVRADVRYGDMLGARYISLSAGGPDTPARLGNTIPAEATNPPVNLTALMNGFEPLFSVLEPEQVNTLARSFVDTFEGRTHSVDLLLTQLADMSANLTDNREVFTRLITNLTGVLDVIDARTPELNRLITGLGDLTTAVVGDDGQLASLLDEGNQAIASLASMMTASGDSFGDSLTELEAITAAWVPETPAFEEFLERMPAFAESLNRSGRYGGFMMLYLCNFTLKAWDLEANIFGPLHSPTCM